MTTKSKPILEMAAVRQYEALRPLVDGLYADIKNLSAKKQDGALSKQRIVMVNRLLKDVAELLKNEPTAGYLELMDEVSIPKNSDALLVIGQYRSALQHYKDKYTYVNLTDDRVWSVRGTEIEAKEEN